MFVIKHNDQKLDPQRFLYTTDEDNKLKFYLFVIGIPAVVVILTIISVVCRWCLRHEPRAENPSKRAVAHTNRAYYG